MRSRGAKIRMALSAVVLLLALTASGQMTKATDPPVALGLWINYGAGTPNFPSGYLITATTVDGQERLWIGTGGGGIAVYDGFAWTRYTVANTSNGLVSDNVTSMAAYGNEVWVGTSAGVSRFNTASGAWATYTTANSGLPHNQVNAVAVGVFDFTQFQFFATPAGLAQHADGSDTWHVYTTANSSLADNGVRDVVLDRSNTFWIVTGGGTNRVVGGIWTTYTNGNTPGCGVIESATRVAVDDDGGRVWFGTDRTGSFDSLPGLGACMFETASATWRRFHAGNSGLADNTVKDLAVDGEGRVWFGTDPFYDWDPGGVYVCTWVNSTCYWRSYATGDGLAGEEVLAVAASLDRAWFGTQNAGLSSLALHWSFLDTGGVYALASQPGRLWVGTENGLRRFDGSTWTTEFSSQPVPAVLPVAMADVWAGTGNGGARHWDGSAWQAYDTSNSGLASNSVLALAHDAQGRIWMGTDDAGVSVYDPASKGWSTFNVGNSPLPANHVAALVVDTQGYVWVGTDNGLARYTGTAWNTYTTTDGLPSSDIRGLAVDKTGYVWAATPGGAARWNGSAWMTLAPATLVGAVQAVNVDPTGRIWLGGTTGVAVYNGSGWKVYRSRDSGLDNEYVRAIATDTDGGVWIGTLTYWSGIGVRFGGLYVRGTFSEPLGLPSPTISSFGPASGPANTVVTITGANFDARAPAYNEVEFRAEGFDHWAPATVLSVNGTTAITARVPAAAVRGPIRVTTAGGAATSSGNFDPLPTITSLDPTSAVAGAPVDIYGSNFDPTTEVRFGTSTWFSLGITRTHNHIHAYVPSDATTGPVQVRTASGTATSPGVFTVGSGSLTIFGWQVHQGVPIGTLQVANKSTVVRVFVGTSDPTLPAYVKHALLRVYRNGLPVFTVEGDVPNDGWFSNRTPQFTRDGSIDFFIPGSQLPAGIYLFQLESPELFDFGDAYYFIPTSDLRIHVSAPGPAPTGEQLALLQRQLAALARAYPVRDGWGDLGSSNGIQYRIHQYQVCDGTQMPHCKGTGYLWDYWQQNPAGQARVRTLKNDMEGATDDGTRITWSLGKVEAGAREERRFLARLRPVASFPPGAFTLISTATLDSPDQSGSPDATATAYLTVYRSAGTASGQVDSAPPVVAMEFDGAAPVAPNLSLAASASRVFDADNSSSTSPGDVIELVFTYENKGDVDADNTTLVIDYDELHMVVYGSGGLVLGSGNTVLTETIPGQFWMAAGWLPGKHDPPMDENYNGVIDTTDLISYVVEFDDWDPATGNVAVSTDLTRVNPGDVIRNFRDSNHNGKHDGGEATSLNVERAAIGQTLLWDVPWDFMSDYNKTAAPAQKAEFSALWFWKGINPIMGPGQGDHPGYRTWANVDDLTSILHELGHNTGQVPYFSPHRTPNGHSHNEYLVGVPAGYDLVGQRVLTTTRMLSIMFPYVQGPVEDAFFEPFEYFDVYSFLRFHQGPAAAAQVVAHSGLFFYISGVVTQDDQVQVANSYLTSGLSPTPADEASDYTLVFLVGRRIAGTHRFPVSFAHEDRDQPDRPVTVTAAPFYVIQPFPGGTTAVEIRHGSTTLARLAVSPNAPWVHVLAPNGGESFPAGTEVLSIQWEAGDSDGDALTYAVRYSADAGATWQTLATGVVLNYLNVPLGTLPGGDNVLIEVEASDGFHTASDRSDAPFQVGKKPPSWAGIIAPANGERLVQSQRVTLAGSGYDLEDGTLSGNALAWFSDRDGFLGRGETISATLTVGQHRITLRATDSDRLNASQTITVEMLSDFDGDGLSDEYEQRHGALNWWNTEDAGADPDGDGLTNRGEAAWGTDPANPDTDGDGISDGDEVAQSSLPGDPTSQPQAPQLLASRTELRFVAEAGGPDPSPQQVLLMSSTPDNLAWTAEVDVPWLSRDPVSGTTPSVITVTAQVGGLPPGDHAGHVTLRSGSMTRVIPVHLVVTSAPGQDHTIYLPLVLR